MNMQGRAGNVAFWTQKRGIRGKGRETAQTGRDSGENEKPLENQGFKGLVVGKGFEPSKTESSDLQSEEI